MHTPAPSAHTCTPPAQDAASAPVESIALGALAKGYVPQYLVWAMRDQQSADLLKQMYCKRKDKDDAQSIAIWSGHYALRLKVEKHMEGLRNRGGLLFFGQVPALTAARSIVVEGGAA